MFILEGATFFNFESFAQGFLSQIVWIIVISAGAIGIGAYLTQGVGSALAKIAGAIAFIALLIALTKGKEIGQWLVDNLLTVNSSYPSHPVIGAITNGIQLYTRI